MTPSVRQVVLFNNIYPGASVALDFAAGRYRLGSQKGNAPSLLSGWTFTRASTGYAETAAGALVAFASGSPRITDKGLLVEEARTNLLLRSQEFDNASWSKTRSSVTANAVSAPDGTLTADMLVEDTAVTNNHFASQSITVSSGAAYAYSVYAKAGTRSILFISDANATAKGATFNLGTGVVSDVGASLTSASITALADGWYRCTIILTTATTTFNCGICLRTTVGAGVENYTGDGVSGLYLWGAQLEAGSFSTSYIPTTTASATRAADVAYVTGVATPPAGFTLLAEFMLNGIGSNIQTPTQFDDGTENNRSLIYLLHEASPYYITQTDHVTQAQDFTGGTSAVGSTFKAALRINTNDFRAAGNGTLGSADASGSLPTAPTVLRFGNNAWGAQPANSYIRRAILYPRAFSDAELQAATA